MSTVFVVHSGEPWGHQQLPCSRQMIPFLEKNEGLVTWVQVFCALLWPFCGALMIAWCPSSHAEDQ